jgi:multiple sugar transport system substrate-binding protein
MINWFGFASMAETVEDSRVKGRVAVAPIPHAAGSAGASLNCYWLVGIAAGCPRPETAYAFVRSLCTAASDKLRTLDGAIGCRRSTWEDPEVNEVIPFYHEMANLHAHARELPRLTAWVELSAVIDRAVLRAVDTADPVEKIVRDAQEELRSVSGGRRSV